ncbi:hypothetical protein BGW38_000752 [Lunasporangiospora selenospora]|uniref:BZIP domain-containing protein n=1 Tax=Lunasporangiospora selenospora TaxID=979761 RepID=A0A9P6FUU6_9FUNG|nr:hypothetical protein BGW38_000752 [Lunasporangiospora selenospora]
MDKTGVSSETIELSGSEDPSQQPPTKIRKKPGRKPNPASPAVRKEQNRAAQRAFRDRKEKHLHELEQSVNSLKELHTQVVQRSQREAQESKDTVESLRNENFYLREVVFSFETALSKGGYVTVLQEVKADLYRRHYEKHTVKKTTSDGKAGVEESVPPPKKSSPDPHASTNSGLKPKAGDAALLRDGRLTAQAIPPNSQQPSSSSGPNSSSGSRTTAISSWQGTTPVIDPRDDSILSVSNDILYKPPPHMAAHARTTTSTSTTSTPVTTPSSSLPQSASSEKERRVSKHTSSSRRPASLPGSVIEQPLTIVRSGVSSPAPPSPSSPLPQFSPWGSRPTEYTKQPSVFDELQSSLFPPGTLQSIIRCNMPTPQEIVNDVTLFEHLQEHRLPSSSLPHPHPHRALRDPVIAPGHSFLALTASASSMDMEMGEVTATMTTVTSASGTKCSNLPSNDRRKPCSPSTMRVANANLPSSVSLRLVDDERDNGDDGDDEDDEDEVDGEEFGAPLAKEDTLGLDDGLKQDVFPSVRLQLEIRILASAPPVVDPNIDPKVYELPHDPRIDLIPCPKLRAQLILYQGKYDIEDLCQILIAGAICHGHPLDPHSWELPDAFFDRYGFLLGEEMMRHKNKIWPKKGQPFFSPCLF